MGDTKYTNLLKGDCGMEYYKESAEYLQHIESMKRILNHVKALESTISSLHFALESENVQQQALDAIQCIGICVNEIGNQLESQLSIAE